MYGAPLSLLADEAPLPAPEPLAPPPAVPFERRELLPDSRARTIVTPRGMVQGPGGMWVPVYCANCGADGGLCPEVNMTFMFYLCNKCVFTHGRIAATMMVPDEVFWQKVKDEQMATYNRYLSIEELMQVVEADASPLATLLTSR
jgi:hypothetical protein